MLLWHILGERQTDRQTDRQTGRQRRRYRERDREREREFALIVCIYNACAQGRACIHVCGVEVCM